MKRLFALLLAVLALSACESTETRVRNVSETFLNAYYTSDYAAAAACCTPAYAAHLNRLAEQVAELPAETEQKMKEALAGTSFEIVSIEVDEEASTALVHYELSIPSVEKPVPMSLRLQLEGRTALVDGVQ